MVAAAADADEALRVLSRIIPHLGLDQPVYGLQPRWLDGHSEPYSDVQETALDLFAELRAVQPKGPYLLGGNCAGGVIALAIAQELIRRGEEVRLLVMLDTFRPSAIRSFAFDIFLRFYNAQLRAKHIGSVIGHLVNADRRSRVQVVRDVIDRKLRGNRAKTPEELAFLRISKLNLDYARAIYQHKLKKYPGRITLIVNEKQYRGFDQSMGWNGVASEGLQVISTPGDHWTRFLHGEELGKRLAACIARCSPETTS